MRVLSKKQINAGRAVLAALLILAISPLSLWCTEPKAPPLTSLQAIEAIRAQPDVRADSGYMVLREFKPTSDGAKLAKLALKDAQKAHTELFRNGVLASLLREGGYLVAEYDPKTKLPLNLYYVTRDANGREMVDKENISTEDSDDKATVNDVQDVIAETQLFITDLLESGSSDLSDLVRKSFDRVPKYDKEMASYFGVPRKLLGFATQQEIEDFSALFSASHLWGFRRALSFIGYSANPRKALIAAFDLRETLIGQFLKMKKMSGDQACLSAPLRISNPEQLKECIEWLRELNTYLDPQAVPPKSQWIFEVNLSIAALPFDMGCVGNKNPDGTGCTLALTAGVIPSWFRPPDGKFKLVAISEDE